MVRNIETVAINDSNISIGVLGKYNEAEVFAYDLDKGSIGLLKALCDSPMSEGSKIRIMPDVHPGKGCVIGTTMTLTDKVAPGLVGVDIGCGIYITKLDCKRMEFQKLDKVIREGIPSGFNIRKKAHSYADYTRVRDLICIDHINIDKVLNSMGTLGGGNHFIEIDKDSSGNLYLSIHTGSRSLGYEIAKYYQDLAYKDMPSDIPYEFAYLTGDLMQDYLHDMAIAQHYACLNREAIAYTICKKMKFDADEWECDIPHNYIDTTTNILRKGAIDASEGKNIAIPLNMKDGIVLGKGRGNTKWNYSAPHGAGRCITRSEVSQYYTLSQYKKEMKGIYSTSINKDTLDESPMAYKPMDDVMNFAQDTVEVTDIIKPVYNFKAGSND